MVQQLEMQAAAVLIMCWKDAEEKRGKPRFMHLRNVRKPARYIIVVSWTAGVEPEFPVGRLHAAGQCLAQRQIIELLYSRI